MTDTTTQQPLRVRPDPVAGPYVSIPLSQLDDLKRLLDDRGVFYWADEHAISLNGEPYVIVVNFGRNAEAADVQRVLDSAR